MALESAMGSPALDVEAAADPRDEDALRGFEPREQGVGVQRGLVIILRFTAIGSVYSIRG
ncbi:hypothetical protein ACF08M_31965 [Streptomyces sp. NPDC015032]|uniref:hypothetical protein n=1 Tax=Streptomyces sp. NPDC015032 TaxID=3364937 RepID=UPI0036F8E5C6